MLGLGLSCIAQKPIFIFDVSGKGNAKLWVYDAQKIGNSQYRYRTIFCFDSQNSNMKQEEILLAIHYSNEIAKVENPVLFFESMNGESHFSYLDPNNKEKRQLFSDNISELLLSPYITRAQKKTEEIKLKKGNQSNPKMQNKKSKSAQSNTNINKTSGDELHKLQKMQEKLEKTISKLEKELAEIEKRKDDVQTELNKVDSSINENESKIQEQEQTIIGNESQLLNLKQKNEKDEELIETQGKYNADLEAIIQKQENEIKENDEMILQCKKKCKENNVTINRSHQNQEELKSKKGKQEENHKTEGYNKAIRFLSLPTCTDNAASKFSLFYFLAWVFSWLFDFCKDYVSQTCTIIDLNRKFAQLRNHLLPAANNTDTIIKNSSETANDIFELLDVFLPKLEGEFFSRYASIYITMLNLYTHDTNKIYEALSQNNISNRDNEVLRTLKKRTKPVENQKNEFIFINEELNNDNNELQKNINLNNNIIDLK